MGIEAPTSIVMPVRCAPKKAPCPRCGKRGRRKHVERTNRLFRFLEKVRSKWRRRQTLVRFVVLKLDEVWSYRSSPKAAKFKTEQSSGGRKTQADAGQRSRQAA